LDRSDNQGSPPVDLAYIHNMMGGDVPLMKELFSTFLADVAAKLPLMDTAMASFRSHDLFQFAHSFSGTATCLGAHGLHKRAQLLEEHARARHLEESKQAFVDFREELIRTRDFFVAQMESYD